MKVRNILIGLLVVLMAFVFISCEDEPEPQPQPQPQPGPVDNTIYKLTATKGLSDGFYKYDKFVLDFNEEIYEGDTVSLLFRSSRDVYQVSIRSIDGNTKYVYEVGVDVEDKPYTLEDMGDGWTKLSYTFGEGVEADNFRVDFRVRTIVGDFIEIKNVFIGNKSITLSEANVDTETYGSVLPTFAETADHDWVTDSTYTVAFFTAKPHYEDDYPVMQAVIKGGKISTAELTNDGYYIDKIEVISDFHKDGDMVLVEFDPETSTIDADTNLLVTWKGVDRTVTFETNGAAPMEAKTVENGQVLVLTNEEQPERALYMFAGWYTDAGLTNAFNIATTPVTSDLTLYAKWILAENAKTVIIELNTDGEVDNVLAADILASFVLEEGGTIADALKPTSDQYYPGFLFEGWYVGDSLTPFDFDAPVNDDVTVSARWTAGTLYRLEAKKNGSESLYDYDKIEVRQASASVSDGDVLSFRYRTTKMNTGFSIRRATDDKKWIYQNTDATHNYGLTTYEAKEDGWIYVTYKFDHTKAIDSSSLTGSSENYYLHFFNRYDDPSGNPGIEKGDIIEIQGWAINNVAATITADDVKGYAGANFSTILGGEYAWESHDVSFNTGVFDPIADITVEYGQKVELPEDPTSLSYVFIGWYLDSEFTEAFNPNTRIIEDITLYAKYGETKTVTFNTNGGSSIESAKVASGEPVAKPADPTLADNAFGGWYADALLSEAYDFATPVTADITLYAKWDPVWYVTLNYNDGDTPTTEVVSVGKGSVMAQPKNLIRLGYYFGGWYDDAGGTAAHDFSVAVTGNTTIYAKWNDPKTYLCTSTVSDTRWQFRWHEDTVAMFDGNIQPGDVFTLELYFPEGNTLAENYWRLRTRSGEKHITENISFALTPKDEYDTWYQITVTVPNSITNGTGLYLQVYGAGEVNWPVGSKMYIRGFAFNGEEIPIDANDYGDHNSHKGAYEKICPDVELVVL